MTGRIGEDVARQSPGSNRDDPRTCFIDVVDHHVEMELLWVVRVGPPWRLVIEGQLERQAGCRGIASDDHPVVGVVGDRQSEQVAVEAGERTRVGAVDDNMVESADHASIMSFGRVRRCAAGGATFGA